MADEERERKPVTDSVPQVDNAIAVGEDLSFQRRWWRFERAIWWVFGLLLLADAAGAFGRGYLSKAHQTTPDQTVDLQYERVVRANTPSVMSIKFGPGAVRDGQVKLHVSEAILQQLGAQRVIPQPAITTVEKEGVTYAFPVNGDAGMVQIALEPSFPGVHRFSIGVVGADTLAEKIAVMP